MTSKERVMTAFSRNEPDRVPINYSANPGIDRRLKEHFGLAPDDAEGLMQRLGVDFRRVSAAYRGPKLHRDIPEKGIKADIWGIHRRWMEHDTGGYWDYCDFPLKEAAEEEAAEWPMPNPDDYDYSMVRQGCGKQGQYAVFTGGQGIGDIINKNGMLRGTEQSLIDLITDNPAGRILSERRTDIDVEVLTRTIEAADGGIDFLYMGEDLGSQEGPLISRDLYLKNIRPFHRKIIDMAKSFDLPVMMHSCGSSSWAFSDFIELGVDVVDTLQPEAKDMSPAYLKSEFGDRLAFHGCISTAGPVATGSPEDVREYCRNTLDIMMPGGGYCFAPTHQLQDNSPAENVVAMYETAREYGVYT